MVRATKSRDDGFNIFYTGINLGAAMSPLLCVFHWRDLRLALWIRVGHDRHVDRTGCVCDAEPDHAIANYGRCDCFGDRNVGVPTRQHLCDWDQHFCCCLLDGRCGGCVDCTVARRASQMGWGQTGGRGYKARLENLSWHRDRDSDFCSYWFRDFHRSLQPPADAKLKTKEVLLNERVEFLANLNVDSDTIAQVKAAGISVEPKLRGEPYQMLDREWIAQGQIQRMAVWNGQISWVSF